ncbi:MAG: class I SAM-dependent methyltransferase [Chloroflexi bacterium]|nr:class I SAM-dependent methyltransferase [Chloroflexota bacterium]
MTSGSQRSSQEQFGRMAQSYSNSTTHTTRNSLVDIREFVEGRHYKIGVDIGTGPGFTAFTVAPFCDRVIATDVTPQMLEEVRRLRGERDAPETQIALVAAEALPFQDASIDLIVTRTASHHFVDLPGWLREVERVLAPGGLLVNGDTCAPEDESAAAWMHEIELRRDRSHGRNLAPSQWKTAVEDAGLHVTDIAMSYVILQYPDWAERAGMTDGDSAEMRRDLLAAPDEAQQAFDFQENPDGTIDFHWDVVVVSAVKAASTEPGA